MEGNLALDGDYGDGGEARQPADSRTPPASRGADTAATPPMTTPTEQRPLHSIPFSVRRRSVRLASGSALATTLAGVLVSVGPSSAALVAPDSSGVAIVVRDAGQQEAPRPAAAIDTSSRSAVLQAWRRMVEPSRRIENRWAGSVKGCRPGRMSPAATRAVLNEVNFVRGLGGLAPVTMSPVLSAKAQQAALIMSANRMLTHVVPRNARCWSSGGAEAARNSNLFLASTLGVEHIVAGYMKDPGTANVAVGHRRWIMHPPATTFGVGLTDSANALWVLGPHSSRNPNPAWVSWPTRGWFPSGFEPNGRWSLSAGSRSADFSQARVAVTRGGKRLQVQQHRVQNGFGMPTLVWEVPQAREVGTYQVTVSGIRGAAAGTHSYSVRIFDPEA